MSPAAVTPVKQWYHLALVFDGDAQIGRIYVDGVQVSSEHVAPIDDLSDAWKTFFLRSRFSQGGPQVDYDEIRIWSRVRSASDIQRSLHSRLRLDDRAGLLAYWSFCDVVLPNDRSADSSGNDHSLSIIMDGDTFSQYSDPPWHLSCTPYPAERVTIRITGNPVTCEGDSITLTADGPYASFLWNNGARTPSIVVTVNSSDSGRYRVVGSDSFFTDGCRDTASVYVHFQPRPHPLVRGPVQVNLCDADTATYTVPWTAGNSYEWLLEGNRGRILTGQGTASITVRWDSAGTARLRMKETAPSGCTGDTLIEVRVSSAAEVRIRLIGSLPRCAGDSVMLQAVPAFIARTWNTGDTTPVITVRHGGSFSVTARTRNGCVASASLTIPALERADIRASGPTDLCTGDSVTLSLARPYSAYRWNSGDTTSTILVRAAGLYTVAVRDSDGCDLSDSILVTVRERPLLGISGPSSVCQPSTVQYHAGNSSSNVYQWSVDSAYGTLLSTNGRYQCTVRWHRAGVCSVRLRMEAPASCPLDTALQIVIRDTLQPAIAMQGAPIFCVGDSVLLDAGDGYEQYEWNTGARSRRIVVRTGGRFRVTVWDANGCRGESAAVETAVHPRPFDVVAGPRLACVGSRCMYSVSDTGDVSFHWSVTGGSIAGGDDGRSILVQWSNIDSGIVRLTRSTIHCSTDTAILVHIGAVLLPAIAPGGVIVLCAGDSLTLDVGKGYAQYQWSTGDTVQSITINSAGCYSVSVTDSLGCSGTDSVRVTVHPRPSPVIPGRVSICDGDSAVVAVSQNYALYWWSRGDTLVGTDSSLVVHLPGTYTIHVTDSAHCEGSAMVIVTLHPSPTPGIVGPDAICEGDTLTLRATDGFDTYDWTDSSGTILSANHDRELTLPTLIPGTHRYLLAVTDSAGCSGVAGPHVVMVHPLPTLPVLTCHGDTVIAEHPSAISYQWYLGSSMVVGESREIIVPTRDGVYSVLIADAHGCRVQSPAYVFAREASATVQLPFLTAVPGERVRIPLSLTASKNLVQGGARDFTALIRFDKNVLVPAGYMPTSTTDDTSRIIVVRDSVSIVRAPLWEMEFLVLLGNTDRTPLHFESFAFDGAPVRLTLIDGEVRVRICREGGDRLFDATGRFGVGGSYPNPFNATTVIDYEVIEHAPTRLTVQDVLGRDIAVLVDATIEPGRYRVTFDATALTSGTYVVVLSTATQKGFRMLRVLK